VKQLLCCGWIGLRGVKFFSRDPFWSYCAGLWLSDYEMIVPLKDGGIKSEDSCWRGKLERNAGCAGARSGKIHVYGRWNARGSAGEDEHEATK
jgi:hypothetical protein